MNEAVAKLKAEVAAIKETDAAATAFIAGIVAQLRDNAGDADAVNALADELEADRVGLAGAITTPPAE